MHYYMRMKIVFGRFVIKCSSLLPFSSLLKNADRDIGTHVYHDKASGTGNILRRFLVLLSYSQIKQCTWHIQTLSQEGGGEGRGLLALLAFLP